MCVSRTRPQCFQVVITCDYAAGGLETGQRRTRRTFVYERRRVDDACFQAARSCLPMTLSSRIGFTPSKIGSTCASTT